MVAGNMMLLAEVHPDDAYQWFMEMFVDSAEWVMVPNVYGMALYADGGTITTKPYFCGSNYLRKMGDYPKGEWITALDALFWRFMAKHRRFFEKQPRLGMLCRHLDRQNDERRAELAAAAEAFLEANTQLVEDDSQELPPVSLTMRGAGFTTSGNTPPAGL
jgi:deoxyribodipyrimidine photolyase-related protein